ncbi:MAG: PilZ domain-containing protein [Desulfuromusa sp.]|nr:PilZ domain-containing protein [Desulfuromusa sp.]
MTEQRSDRRIDFLTEADISIDSTVYRCDLVDLALQGALFRSERELTLLLGSQVPLTIHSPDSSVRMEFIGELIHQRGNFYGFMFTSEKTENMAHLHRLLELNFGAAEQPKGEFSQWMKRGSAD